MKKYIKLISVFATICLLSVMMSSCGKFSVTNVRQFCPSPYYGMEVYPQYTIYNPIENRKATAVADGTLYMVIDSGTYLDSSDESDIIHKIPDSFYLMKCGEEEWEKLAEAPLAPKYKDACIPLLIDDTDRIFAVADVGIGICVYEYVDGDLVPNTYANAEFEENKYHLKIGAEIRCDEGGAGTIYMCYSLNSSLHLLTYDIENKAFSDKILVTGYKEKENPQPYIFFSNENTVEIIWVGQDMLNYYLVNTSQPSPELVESKSLAGKLLEDYYWGTDELSGADVVRSENGDIHIVTMVSKHGDEYFRRSYAHMVVKDGETVHAEIFMPSSRNFVQLFVGADGQAYMLMIQNEQEMLPEEFNNYFDGISEGYINGVFYALSEYGVEELGAVYAEGMPYVFNSFQLTADKEKRIVYICYKGYFTDNMVTCEISY